MHVAGAAIPPRLENAPAKAGAKEGAMLRGFLFLALAVLAGACGGGKGSPTAPETPVIPPGTPAWGTIVVVYDRSQAGVSTCRSAGSEVDRCEGSVTMSLRGWAGAPIGLRMEPLGDGKFVAETTAPLTPPPQRLGVTVSDSWLCPPGVWICTTSLTGRGITVNGVRLKDGDEVAYFSFIPPNVYP